VNSCISALNVVLLSRCITGVSDVRKHPIILLNRSLKMMFKHCHSEHDNVIIIHPLLVWCLESVGRLCSFAVAGKLSKSFTTFIICLFDEWRVVLHSFINGTPLEWVSLLSYNTALDSSWKDWMTITQRIAVECPDGKTLLFAEYWTLPRCLLEPSHRRSVAFRSRAICIVWCYGCCYISTNVPGLLVFFKLTLLIISRLCA